MGYWYLEDEELSSLVGKKVTKILISEGCLIFETDQGRVGFGVDGDCCSYSYFYDITGPQKLLDNGPIVSARELDLSHDNHDQDYEYIRVYGYEFVSEHPVFGEQTTVVTFRNSSNGYYGGSMYLLHAPDEIDTSEGFLVAEGDFLAVD
jgi:hypothetical protein